MTEPTIILAAAIVMSSGAWRNGHGFLEKAGDRRYLTKMAAGGSHHNYLVSCLRRRPEI